MRQKPWPKLCALRHVIVCCVCCGCRVLCCVACCMTRGNKLRVVRCVCCAVSCARVERHCACGATSVERERGLKVTCGETCVFCLKGISEGLTWSIELWNEEELRRV